MMPSSVIKRKQKIAQMDRETAMEYFRPLELDQIKSMERRHCVKPGTYTRFYRMVTCQTEDSQ